MDDSVPLLERAKFLAIFSNNLDEFFMIRVAGLKRRIATGLAVRSASGLEPREVLERISEVSHQLTSLQAQVFLEQVQPALAAEGITIAHWDDLTDDEREPLHQLFTEHIFPVLTPLSVDPAHPFPYISGLSLNLAVTLVNPKTGNEHFARVKVPPSLPRLLRVDPQSHEGDYNARFVPLEDVIAVHLDQLFTGMEVHEHTTFRVTRNEDLEVEEDDAENLLTALEKELTRRRFGPPVRLEVEEDIDDHVLDLLRRELQIRGSEVYRVPAPLDMRSLFIVGDLERSDLKYDAFVPLTQPDLSPAESSKQGDIFASMRAKDVLLHHPYDSFSTSVQAFIEQAAADPRVLAIKQTLYRTSRRLAHRRRPHRRRRGRQAGAGRGGDQGPLRRGQQHQLGPQARAVGRPRRLRHRRPEDPRQAVPRRPPGGRGPACATATSAPATTTRRRPASTRTSASSPATPRSARTSPGCSTSSRASRPAAASSACSSRRARCAPACWSRSRRRSSGTRSPARAGSCSRSTRSSTSRSSTRSTGRRSVGVQVDIWVRAICALRPGIPGVSDTITVRSSLGRFLEHSRIFWFGGDGDPVVYIGSADMMHRNLDRRVEALLRITDPAHVADITSLLDKGTSPTTSRWELSSDGRWTRHHRGPDGEPLTDVQTALIDMHLKRRRKARRR